MNNINEKECISCNIVKNLDEFHNCKKGKYGKYSQCRKCANYKGRYNYHKNKKKKNEYYKNWLAKNPITHRTYKARRYMSIVASRWWIYNKATFITNDDVRNKFSDETKCSICSGEIEKNKFYIVIIDKSITLDKNNFDFACKKCADASEEAEDERQWQEKYGDAK